MSLQNMKLLLAPPAWRLLAAGARLDPFDARQAPCPGPYIFACLHRDILPAIMFVKPSRPALLVSNSPDGDILVRTLGRRNYRFVRGASGSTGSRALVGLKRELAQGHSVGVAVDGPEGPYGKIQDGIFHLARASGAPILPLVARLDRPLVLNTWDRTVVPKPFRAATVEIGRPLRVAAGTDTDEFQRARDEMAAFFGVGGDQA